MLFRKLIERGSSVKIHVVIFSGVLTLLFIFTLSACTGAKGSIVILEDGHGTGFTMDLKEYNSKSKCELSLVKGDVVQVEIECKEGEIALMVSGKNGSEPYTGNNLKSGIFTVTVPETDEYIMRITGKNATGQVMIKNVGSAVE